MSGLGEKLLSSGGSTSDARGRAKPQFRNADKLMQYEGEIALRVIAALPHCIAGFVKKLLDPGLLRAQALLSLHRCAAGTHLF
jgi:hypothetical protein